jgi:hypothetical protein
VAPYWKTADEGSSTTLVAALDPALNGRLAWVLQPMSFGGSTDTCLGITEVKGLYLSDCQLAEPFPHASDPVAADRLWKLSEELVGERFSLEG